MQEIRRQWAIQKPVNATGGIAVPIVPDLQHVKEIAYLRLPTHFAHSIWQNGQHPPQIQQVRGRPTHVLAAPQAHLLEGPHAMQVCRQLNHRAAPRQAQPSAAFSRGALQLLGLNPVCHRSPISRGLPRRVFTRELIPHPSPTHVESDKRQEMASRLARKSD